MKPIKPVLSVIILICILFVVVFFKMEVRRLGYSVLKMNQIEKQLKSEKRLKLLRLTNLNRPSRVNQYAKDTFTLRDPNSQQVILLTRTQLKID